MLIIVFSFFVSLLQAQSEYQIQSVFDFYKMSKRLEQGPVSELKEGKIEGSPYFNNDFLNGTIYTIQKEKYTNIPMRYNIYNDIIEIKTESGEKMGISVPEVVEKVEIGEHIFYYLPYWVKNKMKRGYFELVTDGNASLFIRHRVIFRKGELSGAYKDAVPPRFIRDSNDCYIRIGKDAAQPVTNKNDLLFVLAAHKEKITEFVKKNKVKTKNINNLKAVIEYYNSL